MDVPLCKQKIPAIPKEFEQEIFSIAASEEQK